MNDNAVTGEKYVKILEIRNVMILKYWNIHYPTLKPETRMMRYFGGGLSIKLWIATNTTRKEDSCGRKKFK